MSNIVTQRFINCTEEAIGNNIVRSMRQFAQKLDYLPSGLCEMKYGRRDVTIELIRKAIEKFSFNPRYIFEGSGTYFSNTTEHNLNILSIAVDDQNNEKIIHVPIPAQAGYADQYHDPEYMIELPTYSLPDLNFQSGTYRSFDIDGDSMQPTFYKHDRVICSYIESNYWQDAIKDGQLYVLVTTDGIVVKRLYNHIRRNQMVQCCSDNKDFTSFDVHINDIRELWKVSLKMTTRLESESERIRLLEEQIAHQNALIKTLCDTINRKE